MTQEQLTNALDNMVRGTHNQTMEECLDEYYEDGHVHTSTTVTEWLEAHGFVRSNW